LKIILQSINSISLHLMNSQRKNSMVYVLLLLKYGTNIGVSAA